MTDPGVLQMTEEHLLRTVGYL